MPEARVISLRDRDEHGDGEHATRRERSRRTTCAAVTPDGAQCRARAVTDGLCAEHAAEEAALVERPPAEWERKLAGALAFARRRLEGDYAVDEFGFDADLNDHVFMAGVRPI